MTTHLPNPAQRAVGSIVAIALLCIAAPVSLLRVSRLRFGSANPLMGIDPPWEWTNEQIRATVSEPLRDDIVVDALIRASLVVVWAALIVIAGSILFEIAHVVRHRGIPAPRVRGIGWAQHIGRWVAAGLITVLPIVSHHTPALATTSLTAMQTPAAASLPTPVSPGLASQSVASLRQTAPSGEAVVERDQATDRVESPDARRIHTVLRGDSVFSIAATLTDGDDQRTLELADEILDLNLGNDMIDGQRFTNPALIQPGWELELPSVGSTPAPSNPVSTPDVPTTVRHVVDVGDTLSDIADDYLGDADAWAAVWDANRGAEMLDGRTFDDPNLIVPGWEIDVPLTTSHADVDVQPVEAHDGTGAIDAVESDGPTQPDLEPPTDIATPADSTPDMPATSTPATTLPAINVPATATTTTVPAAPDAGPGSSTHGPSSPSEGPSPIRLEYGALLAAGMLALVGVRRRRSLRSARPHTRVPMPPADVAATERRLRALDAGERAARIDVTTRAIAHQLVAADSHAQIGTVRAAPDGELTIRLTANAHLAAPLIGDASPGGTWTLPASVPIELLSDDARQAGQPCHTLVTVGLDVDGRDVLIDLEAAGITTIEATPDQGDAIVRAIGSGLATSLAAEVAHLVVAGLGTDCLFDHPNGRAHDDAASSIDAAIALVGSTCAAERTSFDLRTRRTGGEMWEPAVVLLAHSDNAAAHLEPDALPAAGHGIAIVAVTDCDDGLEPRAGARLRATSQCWQLDAFGESIDVQPIGVTTDDVAEIVAVLDHATTTIDSPAEPIDTGTTLQGATLGDATVDAGDTSTAFDERVHHIIVRLMGGVDVVDRNGTLGTFERSKTVELIAWLATHRTRATRTGARTALWELDVRDATFANVVSEARRGLGRLVTPPEGEEWLARTLTESLPLHEHVVTDVDLMRERLEHARLASPSHAIDLLRPAVEMIRDMPFAGTSYLWPDADGLTSDLVLLATSITTELAEHALSLGDIDLVFQATSRGLTVLPGHEDLIGLRMRAHARGGDLAGVRQEWESYERVITADSWSDGEPAPKLLDLRRQLLTPT